MERPLKPCPEPGCPNLIRAHDHRARCDLHRTASPYDHAWQRVRAEHLEMEPRCRLCGIGAVEVDHIIPVRAGGARLDHANLRSVCVNCHHRITPREYTVRPTANYRRSRERRHRPR